MGEFIPQSLCLGTRPQTPSPLRDKQKPACMLHHRLAFIGFKSLHFLRNLHQLLTNRQMLRTSPFALAALFARRRPCALIHILPRRFKGKLVVVHRILVHHSEIARDIHPKRTGHAVLTTRAADKYPRLNRRANLIDNRQLRFIERLKMAERRQIVLDLFFRRHAGENDLAIIQTRDPAHRPRRNRPIRMHRFEFLRDVLTERGKAPALDRLHDEHRNAHPLRQLIALHARLNFRIHVIELDLTEIPLALGQNLFKYFIAVVEGKTEMADSACSLLLLQIANDAHRLRLAPTVRR